MRFLRTNTACRLTVGPFLDETDGITPQTALTVTSEKLTFMVDDANVPTLVIDAAPTASGGNNDMVHVTGDDSGFYDLELTAAQTNYLGRAMLSLNNVAAHCPVWHEFMILPAMIYDAFILGTDRLDANVTHVADTAQTAGDIFSRLPALVSGRIDASVGAMATGVLTATAIAADAITDAKVASDVTIASVTGSVGSVSGAVGSVTGAVGSVTGSVGSVTGAVGSVTAAITLPTIPTDWITANGIAADAIGASELAAGAVTEIAAGISVPSAATIADAVWDEALSGHAVGGSAGAGLTAAGAAGDPWSTTLPGSYTAGSAGKLMYDSLDATVSSRASQTSVTTVDDLLDTEVAALTTNLAALTTTVGAAGAGLTAIPYNSAADDAVLAQVALVKAKTDQLVFTVANVLDANIQRVNDVAITGTGALGDEWGP